MLRPWHLAPAAAFLALAPVEEPSAHAADAPLLAGADVSSNRGCHSIAVTFGHAIALQGSFPADSGLELSLRIDVLGADETGEVWAPKREAISIQAGNQAGLTILTFDPAEPSANLLLSFAHPVHVVLSRDVSPRRLIVTLTDADAPQACAAGSGGSVEPVPHSGSSDLTEGKNSLMAKDYDRAIVLLTRAAGQQAGRQEAQELVGVAQERAGHLAHARAAYETYLRRWPMGPDAARVRQRLDGVKAAIEDEALSEFASRRKAKLATAKGEPSSPLPADRKPPPRPAPPPEPEGWTWTRDGGAGQTLYHNEGLSGLDLLRGSLGHRDVAQSDIVTSADFTLRGRKKDEDVAAHISAYDQRALDGGSDSRTAVSSAYVEMRNRLNGLSFKGGRQYGTGNGLFGRFDGLLGEYDISDLLAIQAVAGSPVYDSTDAPFADQRYFGGAAVKFRSGDKAWTASLYALDQEVSGTVDRRAIGAELGYMRNGVTLHVAADYDIHFSELNSGYVSASFAADQSLYVYGSLDYRHVPFLLTSNALMGQNLDSLPSLVDQVGENTAEELALDRTASALTGTAGMTYSFNGNWQASLEASIANYSGTPASGGVDAFPDPGLEYYVSAMLDGSSVFTENDSVALGLYLIASADSRTYVADLGLRYPLNDDWRINPRLKLGYRNDDLAGFERFSVTPSIGMTYLLSDHWRFEAEAAVRFEHEFGGEDADDTADVMVRTGYRYQF